MFTTVSIHEMVPGTEQRAIEMFSIGTRIARKLEGFISRDILIAVDDPLKLTTVTSWQTMEQLEAFKATSGRPKTGAKLLSTTIMSDVNTKVS